MNYKTYTFEGGVKRWWLNNKLHRTDGPALIEDDGTKEWFLNGELHRTDGPAVEYANGGKYWYLNGKPHREDGPAIEHHNGNKLWFLNGKIHRENGPAAIYFDGSKFWYLNGKKLTEKEFDTRKPNYEDKAKTNCVVSDSAQQRSVVMKSLVELALAVTENEKQRENVSPVVKKALAKHREEQEEAASNDIVALLRRIETHKLEVRGDIRRIKAQLKSSVAGLGDLDRRWAYAESTANFLPVLAFFNLVSASDLANPADFQTMTTVPADFEATEE